MAKKITKKTSLNKYQDGGPKRVVSTSSSGKYKYAEFPNTDENKAKRTLKGIVTFAPSIKKVDQKWKKNENERVDRRDELTKKGTKDVNDISFSKSRTFKEYLMERKKGGSVKSKKKK